MTSISPRTITRLLRRPSLVNALLCSLLLHAGTLSAIHFWSSNSINQFFVVEQRSAIRIDAAFSTAQPDELVENRIDPVETPSEVEWTSPPDVAPHDSAPTSVAALELLPRTLTVTKRTAAATIQRSPENAVPHDAANVGEYLAQVSTPGTRANEPAHAEFKPAAVWAEIARHAVDVASPQTTIGVEQVPGLEDKTSPDFSGNRPPPYPVEAIRLRLEGTVLLRLHVDALGRVERVDIVETSGHAILDNAAVQAVATWRGRPAHRSGQPVATVELLPVRFRFRE